MNITKMLHTKGAHYYSTLGRFIHVKSTSIYHFHSSALAIMLGLGILATGLVQFTGAHDLVDDWGIVMDHAHSPDGVGDPLYQTPGDLGRQARLQTFTRRAFDLLEGNMGALIMVAAGLGAIVSAAFGQYRAAVSLLVVAVGAFILRSLVGIFFEFYSTE